MKKKLFKCMKVVIGLVLIGALSFAIVYDYLDIYKSENRTKTNITAKKVSTKPLTIDIPKASDTGSVTVKDIDGNIYFHYTGKIDIQNGENIEVVVVVPSEEATENTNDN